VKWFRKEAENEDPSCVQHKKLFTLITDLEADQKSEAKLKVSSLVCLYPIDQRKDGSRRTLV
jgi:hypothetical protein